MSTMSTVSEINCEVIEYEKCTGEECPKWRDGKAGRGKVFL